MSDIFGAMTHSTAGLSAQSSRLRHVAENIANADTPGYRRKTIPFEAQLDGTVAPGRTRLDQTELTQVYAPGHPMADDTGHYDGSNVDLIIEIADSRQAQRSYEANLKLFDQARQMAQGVLDLLRR